MTTTAPDDAPSVLVIEDDRDVRRLLERHLRDLGWAVRSAATGEDGLAAARERSPDAVVVDLLLPGMGGAEVVRALRADPCTATCRVVVTSILDRELQLALDPDGVLAKPFTRADVVRVMAVVRGERA